MKCHHCDNQATVHPTQILNGQMHLRICAKAVLKPKVSQTQNLSIGGLMEKVDLEVDSTNPSMVCESCGDSPRL